MVRRVRWWPYVRTVKTTSGAIAVQIIWPSRRVSRRIEHLGSAREAAEFEALRAAARKLWPRVRPCWNSGRMRPESPVRLWKSSVRGRVSVGRLMRGYTRLGLDHAVGGDEVFRD